MHIIIIINSSCLMCAHPARVLKLDGQPKRTHMVFIIIYFNIIFTSNLVLLLLLIFSVKKKTNGQEIRRKLQVQSR